MRRFAIMIAAAVLITLGFAGVVYAKGTFASIEMDVPCESFEPPPGRAE